MNITKICDTVIMAYQRCLIYTKTRHLLMTFPCQCHGWWIRLRSDAAMTQLVLQQPVSIGQLPIKSNNIIKTNQYYYFW